MTTTTGRAMTLAAPSTGWRQSSACQGIDIETVFSDSPKAQRRTQGICRGCPVRATCLRDGIAFEANSYMRWGVVGGLNSVQRRALHCEALLRRVPDLRQAQVLASPVWAEPMCEWRDADLTPEQVVAELRGRGVLASAVTARVALWWIGGKGSLVPVRASGDSRYLWQQVRDGFRDVVYRLYELDARKRDIAAYLGVSEDALSSAVTAWRAQDRLGVAA